MSLIIRLEGQSGEKDIGIMTANINSQLREIGVIHYKFSPKVIPDETILPCLCLRATSISYLKFVAAKFKANPKWIPDESFSSQKITSESYEKFRKENKSHLICHNNSFGCYVPVKFPDSSLPSGCLFSFGSSVNLCNELKEIAGRLQFDLGEYTPDLEVLAQNRWDELEGDQLFFEKAMILYLYNFCLASVQHGLIIHFSG
jgi:hypothetical protein